MTVPLKGRRINRTDPYEVAKRLERTVKKLIRDMTAEEAKRFRSGLSMYDENGELIEAGYQLGSGC